MPEADFIGRAAHGEYSKRQGIKDGPGRRARWSHSIYWLNGRVQHSRMIVPRKTRFPHPPEDYLDAFWSRVAERKVGEMDWSRPRYLEALFWAPHPPFDVPEPYYSMYPEDEIELPQTVGRWPDGQPASLLLQPTKIAAAGLDRENWRAVRSAYFGLVTMVDACIGRVIDALKERGAWEESLVIFTQDHGDMLGDHALYQKQCFYEPAAHVPLMIKPPSGWGVEPGRREHLCTASDFCVTVCDAAGADPPPGADARSWLAPLRDANSDWRDEVFMEENGDQHVAPQRRRCVVADVDGETWKYAWHKGDVDELYNVSADPTEVNSLVHEPDCAEIRRGLRGRLNGWMRRTRDFERLPDE